MPKGTPALPQKTGEHLEGEQFMAIARDVWVPRLPEMLSKMMAQALAADGRNSLMAQTEILNRLFGRSIERSHQETRSAITISIKPMGPEGALIEGEVRELPAIEAPPPELPLLDLPEGTQVLEGILVDLQSEGVQVVEDPPALPPRSKKKGKGAAIERPQVHSTDPDFSL